MDKVVLWAARLALAIVTGFALFGAWDPNHDSHRFLAAPDRVEHAAYAYLIALLAIAAAPRLNPWLVAAGLVTAGWGVEVLQGLDIVSGDAQWHDAAADLIGVTLAMLPFSLGRLGARLGAAGKAAPSSV